MKSLVFSAIVLTGLVLFAPLAIAAERNVPSEYATIQAAINDCNSGDAVIIAPGTYYENITIPAKNLTIRSEDTNNSSTTIINGNQLGRVINITGCCVTIAIEGLTITNGLANFGGGIKWAGGGYLNINNCRIINNRTNDGADGDETIFPQPGGDGAGIYCGGGGTVYINLSGCEISGNICGRGGNGFYMPPAAYPPGSGGNGGGVYCNSCVLDINNCVIQQSTAGNGGYGRFFGGNGGEGAGICSISSVANIHNSKFKLNTSGYAGGSMFPQPEYTYSGGDGGAIYCNSGVIENCLIAQNSAGGVISPAGSGSHSGNGGGIYCGSTTINNCTIADNTVITSANGGSGGGIYAGSGVIVQNSIIWGNNAQANPQIYGSPAVIYSDVQGGFAGTGNIDTDPCFITGPNGNYYLSQIAAGQVINSPCVNAGSNSSMELSMNCKTTRTDDVGDFGTVDMGYHYPATIYVGSPDLNGDFAVDFIDYAILAGDWKTTFNPLISNGDILKDGLVDIYDLALLTESWLNGKYLDIVEPNLVGWWKFDEGSGTTVRDSAGHNDGTIYNASWVSGQINGALYFNGSSAYVEIPDTGNWLDMDNEMTIAVWIKSYSDTPGGAILSKQPSGSASDGAPGNYGFFLIDVFPNFWHQTGLDEEQQAWYGMMETGITAGVWQHVAVTLKEGQTVEFYINGNPTESDAQTEPFGIINNEPLRIGKFKSNEMYFYGEIDDVRIYNRALTPTDITNIYQQGQ